MAWLKGTAENGALIQIFFKLRFHPSENREEPALSEAEGWAASFFASQRSLRLMLFTAKGAKNGRKDRGDKSA